MDFLLLVGPTNNVSTLSINNLSSFLTDERIPSRKRYSSINRASLISSDIMYSVSRPVSFFREEIRPVSFQLVDSCNKSTSTRSQCSHNFEIWVMRVTRLNAASTKLLLKTRQSQQDVTRSIFSNAHSTSKLGGNVELSPRTAATVHHPENPNPTPIANQRVTLDFEDPISAHGSKSVLELLRSIFVLQICRIQTLAQHAESVLNFSKKLLGSGITKAAIKRTLFAQFCGGEDANSIQPTINKLKANGIESILDYAAEDMISDQESNVKDDNDIVAHPPYNQPARIYTYSSEEKCDKNVDVFLECIDAASSCSAKGFAALKVTALGNPLLLKRMSDAIQEANNLFAKFDVNGEGLISRIEFSEVYRCVEWSVLSCLYFSSINLFIFIFSGCSSKMLMTNFLTSSKL